MSYTNLFDLSPGYPMLTLWLLVKTCAYLLYLGLAALGGVLALRALLKDADIRLVWAAGIVLGPLAVAWNVALLMRFWTGQSPYLYLGMALAPFLLMIVLMQRHIRLALADAKIHLKNIIDPLGGPHPLTRFVWLGLSALILFIIVILFLTTFLIPLHGNDPLEYAQAARLITEARSTAIYPFSDASLAGGFYGPWTHPPGFVTLLTIGYFIQGDTIDAGVIRICTPFFAILGFISTLLVGEYIRKGAGVIAAILFLLTPLYLDLIIQNHIDPVRISAFLASVALSFHLIQSPSWRGALALGIAAGLTHFVHSIGLLTLALILPLFGLWGATTLWRRLALGTVCVMSALSVDALFLADNWRLYRSFVSDTPFIWTLPEVPIREYLEYTRGLNGPLEKIFYGVLKGFSKLIEFGPVYLITLLCGFYMLSEWNKEDLKRSVPSIGFWIRERLKALGALVHTALTGTPLPPSRAALLASVLALFYGFLILTMLMGSDLAIKNSRYVMTVQPLIALLGAVALVFIVEKRSDGVWDTLKPYFSTWSDKAKGFVPKRFTKTHSPEQEAAQ
jgi:hypothetical protein